MAAVPGVNQPANDKNFPQSDHWIVKNYELKGREGTCGVAGKFAPTCACAKPSDVLPVLGWLPGFFMNNPLRSTLSDFVCGMTVAAVVIPQGMAYGLLAAVPPVYGLYTAVLPPVVYTFMGSSMHLAVGPFALISMLTAAGIEAVVPEPDKDPEAAVAAAAVIALLSGLVLVALGILRLGFIATLLSDPVLSGYTTAVSVIIPTSQLKYALQVSIKRGSFIQTVTGLVREAAAGHGRLFPLAIFLISIFIILACQKVNRAKRFPRLKKFPIPAELLVVVMSTVVCKIVPWAEDVSVLGAIEKGLPPFKIPELQRFNLSELFSSVLIVSLMTYITAMSVSKTFARKFGYEVDNNQELLALGCSNILGSVSSCYPAAASFSRTAIVGASGAATPLHNVWTVVALVMVLLFVSPLIQTLPHSALAAIVAVSFKSLLFNGFEEMKKCWRVGFSDFIMWSVAFWSTLFTNVTIGIAMAVGADILFLLWKSTMPSYTVLGRLLGSERLYRSREHFVEAQAIPGLMIFRFDESLHFANREVFATSVWQELRAHDAELQGTRAGESTSWSAMFGLSRKEEDKEESEPAQKKAVRAIVLDFSPMSHIDMSGIRTLEKLRSAVAARGTRLVLAHCKYVCYKKLLNMGFFEAFEASGRFDVVCFRDLHDAVLFAEGRLPMPECPEEDGLGALPAPPMGTLGQRSSLPPSESIAGPSGSPTSMDDAESEGGSPVPANRSTYQRQTVEQWLGERGIAVGHEDCGHHEPVNVLPQTRTIPSQPTPALLLNKQAENGGHEDPEQGLSKVPRRSNSDSDIARHRSK